MVEHFLSLFIKAVFIENLALSFFLGIYAKLFSACGLWLIGDNSDFLPQNVINQCGFANVWPAYNSNYAGTMIFWPIIIKCVVLVIVHKGVCSFAC